MQKSHVYFASSSKKIIVAFDEKLADRTREFISITDKSIKEKKMFGGLCFMVDKKMCIGVEQNRLMVRIDPAIMDEVTEKDGCKPMDHNGRVMTGFVFVDKDVVTTKKNLEYWVNLALDYNTLAKPSKKKKK